MFSICIVNAEENAYGYIPEEYNHYYKIDITKNNIVRNRGVYSFYSAIPSSYDLTNVNGKRLIPPRDNQGTAPICWAFASKASNMLNAAAPTAAFIYFFIMKRF